MCLRAELGERIVDKTVPKMMRGAGVDCGIRRGADCHRCKLCRGVAGETFGNAVGRGFGPGGPWGEDGRGRRRAQAALRQWLLRRGLRLPKQGDGRAGGVDQSEYGLACRGRATVSATVRPSRSSGTSGTSSPREGRGPTPCPSRTPRRLRGPLEHEKTPGWVERAGLGGVPEPAHRCCPGLEIGTENDTGHIFLLRKFGE